ncbi:MAG: alpha/beta hydrolase [Thainema sp.]
MTEVQPNRDQSEALAGTTSRLDRQSAIAQHQAEDQAIATFTERAEKDIYFISGLGADERVFRELKFEGYRPVHIHWLEPERGESLSSYACRLSKQVQSDQPILVGLSFGGLVAVEMAKQIDVEQVILLSSAKTTAEIPFYYKIFRWFPLHRVFPFKTLLWAVYWFAYWVFSVETVEERKLLKVILLDTDPHFLKWALHRVVVWKNHTIPDSLHHIHGLCDRIFPMRWIKPDVAIEQAGHLMVLNRASQVSELITQIIETNSNQ